MIICWDNLEKLILIKSHKYFINLENKNKYYHFDECPECKESFLGQKKSKYCSKQCSIKNNNIMYDNEGKNNNFYGRNHSEETKIKLSNKQIYNWESGKYENRKKHTNEGENNPRWKGGNYCKCGKLINKQRARCDKCYKESLNETKERRKNKKLYPSNWQSIAKKVRKGDNYKCQNPYCNINTGYIKLEVHHVNYNKQNCSNENLISLCTSCHMKTNYNKEWHGSFYSELIRKKYMGGVLTLRRIL